MTDLASTVAKWRPEPTEHTDRITAQPTAGFSALLDLPRPAAAAGEPLPPLWHWFSFPEYPRRSELGTDGHPAAGLFLPPIPDRRRMFAGGRLRVNSPILVGDEITRRSEVLDIRVKNGRSGEMLFTTVQYTYSRGTEVLMIEEQDIVYRSQPAGAQRTPRPDPGAPAEPARHGWTIEVPTDPTLLFRFSALTSNSHRIHYDAPYATAVEGYPGLVVHGPLLALLMLEIPRRFQSTRSVTEFEFRLSRPAFCGNTIAVGGDAVDAATVSLFAGAVDAAPGASGTARLTDTAPPTIDTPQ